MSLAEAAGVLRGRAAALPAKVAWALLGQAAASSAKAERALGWGVVQL